MLVGKFDLLKQPRLTGRLAIPGASPDSHIVGEVQFLVDTGAHSTVLMPDDVGRMGIDCNTLTRDPRTSVGVGGRAHNHITPAFVAFEEQGAGIQVYRINLVVFDPNEHLDQAGVPSLLGRDILNRWEMLYNPSKDRLEFRVNSADYSLPIHPDAP